MRQLRSVPSKLIPVMRPLLPTHRDLAPYLKRIDALRFYTNFGPMLQELQHRLSVHFGACPDHVDAACNATLGLWSCFKALPSPGEAWMPSWTFPATPSAAINAGLTPRFFDVDPTTWSLTPSIVESALRRGIKKPAVIVPVAPFGARLPYDEWRNFHQDTKIPVVIDAAAAFDSIKCVKAPLPFFCIVLSLHATKALPASEGSILFCHSGLVKKSVKSFSSFGFRGNGRQSFTPGINAKMSEYAAAIALASLDQWEQTRQNLQQRAQWYKINLPKHLSVQPGFGTEWVSTTCVVQASEALPPNFQNSLLKHYVQTRHWYENGCHQMPAFAQCPCESAMDVTQGLAASTIGLPLFNDIGLQDIQQITDVLGLLSEESSNIHNRRHHA